MAFAFLGAFGGDSIQLANPVDGVVHRASQFRVIDGDTASLGSERIWIDNIDTPEMGARAACLFERELAMRATQHARSAFQRSRSVDITRLGMDRYGRTLAHIRLDGRDFGQMMITDGMAVRWADHQHEWCR